MRAERIRHAAKLVNQSTSAFMLDAASRRADEIIEASAATTVPAGFFDRLWNALDAAPRPNARLARQARARRQIVQR